MLLNCSEISMYQRIHFELKNVQNVLGILLKTILKTRNNRFYKNFYSRNCRMLHVFDTLSRYFGGNINIENTSENIKSGHLKKKRVIYHNEENRVTI